MEYPKATEKEMIKHCDEYPCCNCPIQVRCEMFERFRNWANAISDGDWT